MKRKVSLVLTAILLVSGISVPTQAKVVIKSGVKCAHLGQTVTVAKKRFGCRRSGANLVWRYLGPAPTSKPIDKLLWSEEFNAPVGAAPTPSRWTALLGDGSEQLGLWSYGTGEIELNRANAAATDGSGNLVISANKTNGTWTSARYWTHGKVNFQYGKLEARIKMPVGSFNWPAFWMLGANYQPPNQSFGTTEWPNSGEIDIAEGLNGNSLFNSTIHANNPGTFTDWNGGGGLSAASNLENASDGYHTFGLIWKPNSITFTLDGLVFGSNRLAGNYVIQSIAGIDFNEFYCGGVWPFNKPFFILLNNAINSSAGNAPDGTNSQMLVDWIRYSSYQGYGRVTK